MDGEKKLSMKSLYQEILTLKEQVKEIEPLKLKVIELQETVKNLKNNRNNKKDNEETPAEKEKNCVKIEFVKHLFCFFPHVLPFWSSYTIFYIVKCQ